MNPLVTPGIESLKPYEAGKPIEELARELGVTDAIKVASNENPLGPSPKALQAVQLALASCHRYPDAATYRLRQALSEHHGLQMAEVLPGNGSNELLELLLRTFTTPADHVVFGEPAFVVYKLAAIAQGTPFTGVPLKDHVHDLPAMAAAVRPNTKLLFVANPNNPTGTHVPRAALERLLRDVPPEVIIVLDEAYMEYVEAPDYADGLSLRHLRERLIVLRTFSKIYGLAALRVGWAGGPAHLLDYVNRVRAPFNVNSLGQVAAIAALDDVEHVTRSRESNRRGRARLAAALSELGLAQAPSQTNFIWADLWRPGRQVYEALLRKGVIVRPFGDSTFVRITVGTDAEVDRVIGALREVLG